MAVSKKKTKKKASVEMTLWNVILSYPDLHDPKPYKGKIYYKTDVLLDKDHPQLKELRQALKRVKVETWGEDADEWPEKGNPFVMNGDEREDQSGYAGRFYITASTQTPVPVVDPKGKTFNAQMVKGGMFANVAVRISAWEFDGDEGVSIYLQGVMIDTSKQGLNFGGGKSVKQMFNLEEGEENEQDEDDSDDEDDQPRKAKKKSKPVDEDERDDDDADDSYTDQDDDEDDQPRKKKSKKSARNFDENDDE